MALLPPRIPVVQLRTHAQKVCSLYKRALKNIESWSHLREHFRLEAVRLRAQFDANKNIKDMMLANKLLKEGEKYLFQRLHYDIKQHAHSPGGSAYARDGHGADWILDAWHPLEKSQFPEYFKRREERKKEYVDWYIKTYGDPRKEAPAPH